MDSIIMFWFAIGRQITDTLFVGNFDNDSRSQRAYLHLNAKYQSNALANCILFLSAICITGVLIQVKTKTLKGKQSEISVLIMALTASASESRHVVAQSFLQLVETDGAAPLVPVAEPSLDCGLNLERRERYRSLMREALMARICLFDVRVIMAAIDLCKPESPPRDVYNGFYSCVSAFQHAYRWATIPVVKIAQDEKLVEFPPQLDIPWKLFPRKLGFTSLGGNLVSNYLCSFDPKGRIQYRINTCMSEIIQTAEYRFGHLFVELEALALPIYCEMNQSIIAFERGQYESCLNPVVKINSELRLPLKVFYERMNESNIPRSVWMCYVQGYQGRGAGEIIDGKYVEYDGLSGNQSLFFRAMDAYLGIESYLTDENARRYLSSAQRDLCLSYKGYSFRKRSKKKG